MQMTAMPEVVDPVVAVVVSFALRNLVIVMRELEVDSTGMNVEWAFLKDSCCHC